MPSTKAGVPLTGPRAEETTNNEQTVIYSNFSREPRFSWQRQGQGSRGRPTTTRITIMQWSNMHLSTMSSRTRTTMSARRSASRISNQVFSESKTGQTMLYGTKDFFGRNIKYADLRKEHTSYGKDEALRRQLRYDALKDTSAAQGALQSGLLALENGSVTTSSSSGVDSKFDQEGSQIQTSWLNAWEQANTKSRQRHCQESSLPARACEFTTQTH